jgi:hypothetical protein
VEVVRYLDGHPEADTVEILGRWTGTAAHAVLVELLKSPVTLEDHALQGEFTDGVDKLLGALERNERRRLLAEVREAPTREKFREFWSLRSRERRSPDRPRRTPPPKAPNSGLRPRCRDRQLSHGRPV